jgi:hypothetical protein
MDAKKSKITNTTELYKKNPELGILDALLSTARGGDPSASIEDMEARGQRELVRQTETLPAEGSESPWWAKMGVVFGEPVEGDTLFRRVTLPKGWHLQPTGHAMWSELFDEKNRKRAGVFYKAAFYDRKAHITAFSRFTAQVVRDGEMRGSGVFDADKEIFRTKLVQEPDWGSLKGTDDERHAVTEEYFRQTHAFEKEAQEWIEATHPQWRDPAAYWDAA